MATKTTVVYRNSYGFLNFALDLFLLVATFGLWGIWMIIRFIANHF